MVKVDEDGTTPRGDLRSSSATTALPSRASRYAPTGPHLPHPRGRHRRHPLRRPRAGSQPKPKVEGASVAGDAWSARPDSQAETCHSKRRYGTADPSVRGLPTRRRRVEIAEVIRWAAAITALMAGASVAFSTGPAVVHRTRTGVCRSTVSR